MHFESVCETSPRMRKIWFMISYLAARAWGLKERVTHIHRHHLGQWWLVREVVRGSARGEVCLKRSVAWLRVGLQATVSAHCRFLLPVSERNVAFDEFKMSEVRLRRSIGVMLLLGSRGEKVAMLFGKLSPALFHGRSLRFRSACQTLAPVIFRWCLYWGPKGVRCHAHRSWKFALRL